jgi:hypothetical protein
MNGTSKQDLIDQQIAIMDTADALFAALPAVNPNGRDYYPLGDCGLVRDRTAGAYVEIGRAHAHEPLCGNEEDLLGAIWGR